MIELCAISNSFFDSGQSKGGGERRTTHFVSFGAKSAKSAFSHKTRLLGLTCTKSAFGGIGAKRLKTKQSFVFGVNRPLRTECVDFSVDFDDLDGVFVTDDNR